MSDDIAILWFRQDLRLADNPALAAAAEHGAVLPLYILDDINSGDYRQGAASRWWLHHSLHALNESLAGKLRVYAGNPLDILSALATRYAVRAAYWNRCYEPWRIRRDKDIEQHLSAMHIKAESYNSALLWEPWDIAKADGSPYKVFTPFYRKGCLSAAPPRAPLAKPKNINWLDSATEPATACSIAALGLLPAVRWDSSLEPHWTIGEAGAQAGLQRFIDKGLCDYKQGRDLPAQPFISRLSPHLHFGEISPHQIWHSLRMRGADENIDHFCSELGWREFSYSLLYYNPDLPHRNLQAKFDTFPWQSNADTLRAWQCGQTGIPMVDAGMRELWQTGYMHNRVRMIVGSFLVKNLLLDWRHGERWFWDTLVDADLANNSANWQWVAGCGADAAPYFRIFNPIRQGERFDPQGDYVRRFVPELRDVPARYIHSPWQAPPEILQTARVALGKDYPKPIVDLQTSRDLALAAFRSLGDKAS